MFYTFLYGSVKQGFLKVIYLTILQMLASFLQQEVKIKKITKIVNSYLLRDLMNFNFREKCKL